MAAINTTTIINILMAVFIMEPMFQLSCRADNFFLDHHNFNDGGWQIHKSNEYKKTPLSLFGLSILRQVQNNTAAGPARKIELLRIKDKNEI